MESTYGSSQAGQATRSQPDSALETAKEKVTSQVSELGNQVSSKMDQAKETTHKVLASTSKTLDQAANYLQNQTYQTMFEDVKEVIRQHPGKSILAGIGLGVLIARVCK